jgi:hypothetical protein
MCLIILSGHLSQGPLTPSAVDEDEPMQVEDRDHALISTGDLVYTPEESSTQSLEEYEDNDTSTGRIYSLIPILLSFLFICVAIDMSDESSEIDELPQGMLSIVLRKFLALFLTLPQSFVLCLRLCAWTSYLNRCAGRFKQFLLQKIIYLIGHCKALSNDAYVLVCFC